MYRTLLIVLLLSFIAAAPAPPAPSIGDAAILQYLNRMIDWYRRVNALDETPLDSQEFVFRETARANAKQTLGLAFSFARAVVAGQSDKPVPATNKSGSKNGASGASLTNAANVAADRLSRLRDRLDEVNRTLSSTTATSRPTLEARREKIESAIELANAQLAVLQEYSGFVTSAENGGSADLAVKIDDLQKSVPELGPVGQEQSTDPVEKAATTQPAAAVPSAVPADPPGILAEITRMFALTGRISELAGVSRETGELHQTVDQFRQPIRQSMIDLFRRGAALSAPTTQESDDPQQLEAQRQEIDALATQFKQFSATGVPLGEQSVLLGGSEENLEQWRLALEHHYARTVRSLLIRVIVMGVIILLLIVASELWKRATYRYIRDTRRRRQLMLVRRVVIGAVVVLIVIASVVTEFGSLATFAGLITAGIAVSLQTVILSGVAYFFFIGRFGVRIGDRVTVNGISGDVVEVGLFRLYLMELAGRAPDLHPTGRIVVFSNAVLFQPSAFYKQIPGADYAWHEVALTLARDNDHKVAEQRLMSAVESIFDEYRESIDRQHATAMDSLHLSMPAPRPEGRLRFVDAGIEFVIRYPVSLHESSSIDDRITRSLLDVISQEPRLKLVGAGTPTIS